jgi:uncharacterized protein YdhG (YjbR/CyaY superfamily)
MSAIDEYLDKHANPSQRAVLEHIRKLIHDQVPDVGEKISYGIPTFTYKGTYLLYFAAFKNHLSVYPVSDDMVKAIGEKLATFRTGRGTLRFTEDKPIPDPLLKKIILYRLGASAKS